MVFYRITILTLADKRCINDIKYQHLKAIIIWSFINMNNTEFIFVQRIRIELLKSITLKGNCFGSWYLIAISRLRIVFKDIFAYKDTFLFFSLQKAFMSCFRYIQSLVYMKMNELLIYQEKRSYYIISKLWKLVDLGLY